MNVFNDRDREKLIARIRSLGPSSERRWGTMTLPQAVAHMGHQIGMALGEMEVEPIPGPFRYFGLKYFVIYVMPWPRGVPTAKELRDPDAGEIEEERVKLLELIEKVVAKGKAAPWADHAGFGALSGSAWGALIAKHLNHHLRQFSA